MTPQLASQDASMHLDVTPLIGTEQVQLDLELRWADFNGLDDTGYPQINEKKLETKLRTKIGDEIMIGGLNRQVRLQGKSQVPILGSIPVLGYLLEAKPRRPRRPR